jgi:hypothetical protein
MYTNERQKIAEEFKLRRQWIEEYSDHPQSDTELVREWRQQALEALDNSDISKQAREATKQYLEEQADLHEALDKDEADQEAAEYQEDLEMQKRENISTCWGKVDELE